MMSVFAAACGGDEETATTAGGTETTADATETTGAASGDAIKFGFDEGFTGFMAYDTELAEKGILTALDMMGNQWEGRPLEYLKEDNGSDPVVAVDKMRKLVESDNISTSVGPIFSPSAKAVSDFLGKSSGVPMISIFAWPKENLETASGLTFMHAGILDAYGYYFGKFLAERGYKTANVINYDDTPAYALTDGFRKAFVEEGGGEILSENYVPLDLVDFSAYLTTMPPADLTFFWIFGNGAVPFVKQYNDYGLTAPLATPMANNFSDAQLAELGDMGKGMIGVDLYTYTVDYPMNKDFIAGFQKLYPDEMPTPQAYGAWQAVMMYIEGLKATGGDTAPDKIKPALAALSMDSPTGQIQIVPLQDGYIAKRNLFMLEVQDVSGVLTWVPVKTFEQVVLGDLSDLQ